jgi:hypothetical protein
VTRLAVMAHYDPRGDIGPHVRRQVMALAEAFGEVVVVSTADLTDASRAWFARHARLIERANYGYDFFSYKRGLESVRLEDYDDVVICNDTYVGPLTSYSEIFDQMAERPGDFWGLTASQRISPHLQSFFVCFRPWLVHSQVFRKFWDDMRPVSDRQQVIKSYEVGLSETFTDAGFSWTSYYSETDADRALARRRVSWWAVHRNWFPRDREARELLREERRVAWNPAVGLADVALDGARIPYVKIDTLRYDPYQLNSGKLLTLGEQHCPEAFDGVREYLESTALLYPPREKEVLPRTPVVMRPLKHLVEYGRAL